MSSPWEDRHDALIEELCDDLRKCPLNWETLAQSAKLSTLTLTALAQGWACSKNPTMSTLKAIAKALHTHNTEKA